MRAGFSWEQATKNISLKTWVMRVCSGFIWLGIATSGKPV
jgi:hypothetical protein